MIHVSRRQVTAIAALLMLAAGMLVLAWRMFYSPAINDGGGLNIYVDKDDTHDSLFASIVPRMKPLPKAGFKVLHSLFSPPLRTGHYAVGKDETAMSLFVKFKNGLQSPVRLVVPSVRTSGQLSERLSRQLMLDSASIASALNDSVVCASHGFTVETALAMFIPDTYEVYWDMGIENFIRRMKREHDSFWDGKRRKRAAELGMTELEVSVLASIVDEETTIDDEKPAIAGLYINRLRRRMPLQADPTVKYAVGDFALKRVLNKHLSVDSPYNTYIHRGLPPGPIRVPSKKGIDAVLWHDDNNYLFMCAKEDFSGRHNFASTLQEHNANAARYRRALDKLGIR